MAQIMVIGLAETCETSQGPIAAGEMVRLPLDEALRLSHANQISLASWQEQQLPDPVPSSLRHKYRRRDLQAEE